MEKEWIPEHNYDSLRKADGKEWMLGGQKQCPLPGMIMAPGFVLVKSCKQLICPGEEVSKSIEYRLVSYIDVTVYNNMKNGY